MTPAKIAAEYREAYVEHLKIAAAWSTGELPFAAVKISADNLRHLKASCQVEREFRAAFKA